MSCLVSSGEKLLDDLGVGLPNKVATLVYLRTVECTYKKNKPDISVLIKKIENNGFIDSVNNGVQEIAFGVGLITIMVIIATIVFCISLLISIYVLREPRYAIISLTVYAIFMTLLYYFVRYRFTGIGRSLEIPSVEEEFNAYFDQQKKAINKALCNPEPILVC